MLNKKFIDKLKIIDEKHEKNERCLKIIMFNENLITKDDLYRSIYLTLLSSKIFIDFSSDKVFISSAQDSSGKIFSLHDNMYFSMDLTLTKFLEKCKHCIEDLDNYAYFDNNILNVTVRVWDMSNIANRKIKVPNYLKTNIRLTRISQGNIKLERIRRSYHTTSSKKNNFTPLSKVNIKNLSKIKIATLDIETMYFNNSFTQTRDKKLQTPILITCSYLDENDNLKSFYTLINKFYINNLEYGVFDLWSRFFNKFFKTIKNDVVIFTHNLGDFDGYFIYKALLNIYNQQSLETIIDKHNKCIQISLKKDAQII